MSASVDPTAIPIEWDPTQQRMSGVAIHGNTPFDVPFISEVHERLFVGGCRDGLVLPPNIEHVVSLYPWESYRPRREIRSSLSVRMYDALDVGNEDLVYGIARWVNECIGDGPTLVHCQAGLNRSGLVTALSFILDGHSAADAIDRLRERRSPAVLCNPSFEAWLRERA